MKKISLLLSLAVALGSCNKNSEPAPTASKSDLLMAKSWRISAETSTYAAVGSTPVVTNQYTNLPTCELDNFVKFNANKIAVFDEGANKCNASDPQTQNGIWELTNNDTKLTLTDPTQSSIGPFDVIALSSNTLQIRYSYSYSSNGISATQTQDYTFTAF